MQDGKVSLEQFVHQLRTAPPLPTPVVQAGRPIHIAAKTVGAEGNMTKEGVLAAACRTLPVGSTLRNDIVTLEAASRILADPLEYARIEAGTLVTRAMCRT